MLESNVLKSSAEKRLSRRNLLGMAAKTAAGALLIEAGMARSLAAVAPAQAITGAASLKDHAAAKGLLTGFAVAPRLLKSDAVYRQIVKDQANLLVAENEMKWAALRPSATTFSFDEADSLVSFAEENGMKIRGHNLLWHRGIPQWFTETATKANARQLLETHIETVVGRYAGRMHSWDVVNEALQPSDGRPDGLRDSPWLKLIGEDYIEVAFRAARRADPHALLTYNDYGIEAEGAGDEAKRKDLLLLLRRMRQRQVPIDAVGIQSHISAAGPQGGAQYGDQLMRFIASVRELGLQIFVTEMDVNDRKVAAALPERDEAVAKAYRQFLDLVLRDQAVTAVVFWGVTDKYTWLNQEDSRSDKVSERPLLFDDDGKPKLAYFGVRNAFDATAARKV